MGSDPIIITRRSKISKLKLAGLVGLPIAALGALAYAYFPKSSNMFEGDVNGWNVSYFEAADRSFMSAVKDHVSVTYEDCEAPEKINFKARDPNSLSAKLESVIYRGPKGTEIFSRADIDSSSFDFEVRTQIFDAADRHYNAIRVQIVKDLQKTKLERLTEIRDNLK